MVPGSEADTPELILQAARDLLVSEGIEGLSMRKVGHRVGISAAAIYRHFEGKDALLSAAVHRGALTFASYLIQALAEADARSRLVTMCHRYFAFAHEHFADYQLLFMLNCQKVGFYQLDQSAQAATSQTFQLLVDRVVECQGAAVLAQDDARMQAVFIWTSLHGLVSVWMTGHLHVTLEAYRGLLTQQVELLLGALAPFHA